MKLRLALVAVMLASVAVSISGHGARAAAAPAPSGTQPYTFKPVSIMGGGFITGIVAHPTAPNLMYARTDIGSSYKWDPVNSKWIPLTDFNSAANYNLQGTESIALDPTDPNRLYLAQGMYTSSADAAIFASDDQGKTFSIYPTPFRMGSNNLGRNLGERLAVNPSSPTELYMGTRSNGLYRSEDRAQTWTQVTNFPITSSTDGIGVTFVLFDPAHPGTIYVGANTPGGLYETNDNGATWRSILGQPTAFPYSVPGHPPLSAPRPMRAVLAANGDFYVTYGDAPGPYGVTYGSVYRLDTSTDAWTDITPSDAPDAYPASYDAISVDQHDPNTLVVASLDRDPGPPQDSLYLSHNAGASWANVAALSSPPGNPAGFNGHPMSQAVTPQGVAVPWLNFNDVFSQQGAPSPIPGEAKFGWWIATVLIDPSNPNHLMYGTGATIFATNNLLAADSGHASTWYVQANGIEETAALALISPTSGAHLLSGMGDLNGFRHTDLDVPQNLFTNPDFISTNSIDWAGQNPNVVVRVGQDMNPLATPCQQGAYSSDQGVTWRSLATCVPGVTASSGTGGTIAVDASGQYVAWTPPSGSGGPRSSNNWGVTWTAPTGLTSRTSVAADRVQAATFYGFANGTWYASTDGGVSYTATPAAVTGLPNASAKPVPSFSAAGDVWLPLGNNGLWHSTDFGARWTKVGPAGLVASQVALGKAAPGTATPAVYLWGSAAPAGVTGLYRSDDGGTTWLRINDDAHQYGGPTVIQGDPRIYGRVYFGMNGRGLIYADPTALSCTTTVTGAYRAPLTVSGVTCLTGATISGPVTVRAGAVLIASGTTVQGPLTASGAASVSIDGGTVSGPITITGSTGGIEIAHVGVNGPVVLTGNHGPATTAGITVAGNTVNGPLSCSGNSPNPTDLGTPNTVRGPTTGQCAGL